MDGRSVEKHWSSNEKIALGILLTILAVFSTLFGLMIYTAKAGGGCGGGLVVPCPPREALNILSSTIDSPTNMTLQIMNVGSAATTLISYYVKTANDQTYADTSWPGPTISPNGSAKINILINVQAFTFQAHNLYTVTVITSRYSEFTFSVQN